jgi:aminoglycoside 6'-N-acetyltransferase
MLDPDPSSPPLILRPADIGDLALLCRWDTNPDVLASDPNDDWQWDIELRRAPDWREQLIAEVAGLPIGFIQIIDPAREESHYWGDCALDLRAIDLWIGEPAWRGRGFGSAMLRLAVARCFAHPAVNAVLVDPLASNQGALRFYERHGFVGQGPRRFGADECFVYALGRERWMAGS